MSTTPTPSEQNGGSTTNDNLDDWRLSVSQSYRNTEVREIAKVLAALEPGATSASKLMLAMRFEDTIFKAATSLADYRKKLTKRLKKVQKSYVPTNKVSATNKEELIKELRNKYGDTLRYINKHAPKAIAELKAKHGPDKANQLHQHTQVALQWATNLGLLPNTQPDFSMPEEQAQKLQQHLEKRIENIRSHVVKLAEPDRFLQETLQKAEDDISSRASKLLAMNTSRRFEHISGQKGNFDPSVVLKEALEKTQAPVPPPTKSQRNDEQAALLHLNKMKAAATTILAYMSIPDKTTTPRNILVKAHTVATEGLEFVGEVMKNHRKEFKEPELSLEDAWTKVLESPAPPAAAAPNPDSLEGGRLSPVNTDGGSKRFRGGNAKRPVIKSRVLLTAGRKTPSNLLPAFKRKRATLIRPPPNGEGSHLILEFGKAFVMTIYLVPLLVTIRAYSKNHEETIADRAAGLACAHYTPVDDGLRELEELKVWGIKGTYDTIGHVVEARLEDASAQATAILRRLFANADKEKAPEFELEILEATALLEFLHNARKTFIPDWQDDDD